MQLVSPGALPFKVWSSHMHLRAGNLAGVDVILKTQIGVGFNRAAGTNRGNSAREVQAWKTETHFSKVHPAQRIKHVLMHAHEPWDYCVPLQVYDLRVFRDRDRVRVANRCDFRSVHENSLIFTGCRSSAIDHPHMSERHRGRVDLDESLNLRRKRLGSCQIS